MTSRPVLSAWVKVRVATNDRLTWTDNFLGTSPNGLSSFICVLTQIRYLSIDQNNPNRLINNNNNNNNNNKIPTMPKKDWNWDSLVIESELGVEDSEHALVEGSEEMIHCLF